MVTFNIILLWKYKKVVIYVIEATSYKNDYLLVVIFSDMFLLIKYLIKGAAFEKYLGRSMRKKT